MLGIVLFVGLIPSISFYIGMQYQDMQSTKNAMRVYDVPRLTVYPQTQVGAASASGMAATSTP